MAYVYIAKAINAKKAPAIAAAAAKPEIKAPIQQQAGVLLENVEEKEAAIIMAIVSDKSGIPLERLAFKSIKLMED